MANYTPTLIINHPSHNADVELTPVMVGEDLGKAGPSIGAAVEKYD